MARDHVLATPLTDGRVLVVTSSTTAEIYDPASSSWSPAGQLSQARTLGIAIRLADGRVRVAGGGEYSATAEIYNPATNGWTPTGSMHFGRVSFTGTLLPNGQVLVAGGLSLSGLQASAELYNPATGSWTLTGSLAMPLQEHTATPLPDGTVLVARWPRQQLHGQCGAFMTRAPDAGAPRGR